MAEIQTGFGMASIKREGSVDYDWADGSKPRVTFTREYLEEAAANLGLSVDGVVTKIQRELAG